MTWGAVAVAGASIVGGAMSANAAGDAADQQSASSAQATQAQMMAAAQMRQDLSPWTSAGGAAQSRLNQYLGIGGVGSSGSTSLGLPTGLSADQVRQQLLSRFTSTGTPATASATPKYASERDAVAALGQAGISAYADQNAQVPRNEAEVGTFGTASPAAASPTSTVDEAGLNAAIQQYMTENGAQNAQAEADPNYGSLLQAFHGGAEFDPGPAFGFTGADVATDPGYQFGLQQGTQGINNGQAARGNFLSGAGMKELDRFNQDYAGTKFGDAFNRASTTYNTNLGAKQQAWNTNLGAYNNNRNSIYNFLTGTSTMGQNSAATVGTSNQQTANQVSNNLLSAGNAQAAGTVAGSNSLVSGINGAANAFNTSNNLNSAGGWNTLLSGQGGGYSGYTGYVGNSDPIANLNTSRGWTS